MKRLLIFISAITLAMSFMTGCSVDVADIEKAGEIISELASDIASDIQQDISDSSGFAQGTYSSSKNDISESTLKKAENTVEKDGVYTTPAMVAAYIHTFNKLPQNYITKKEAQQLGWSASKNYVSDVAPGKSIGGDSFGNREGLLPKGKYRECDINYKRGKRNAERIIYNSDGDIYYTGDHYNSFTKLY